MIDHNLKQFDLTETADGEMVLPSEKGNLTVAANLRQFIIQARRNYSQTALSALEDNEGVQVTLHDPEGDEPDEVPMFFYVRLVVKPQGSLKDFANSSEGDAFFDKALELAGNSNVRFKSGKRTAFVSAFNPVQDAALGEVLVSHILIGTTVFYNDYRATVNFPATEEEHTEVVGRFFNTLHDTFPSVDLEISYESVAAQEEVTGTATNWPFPG